MSRKTILMPKRDIETEVDYTKINLRVAGAAETDQTEENQSSYAIPYEAVQSDLPDMSEGGPADRWTTYKDYLKKKRDYKREWRKRKHDQSGGPGKRMRSHSPVRKPSPPRYSTSHRAAVPKRKNQQTLIVREERNILGEPYEIPLQEEVLLKNDQREMTDGICNQGDESEDPGRNIVTIENCEEADDYKSDDAQDIPEEEEEETEMVHEKEEPADEVIVLEDLKFADRWNNLYMRLFSLEDTSRRWRYLKLIEGLVEELCAP